jgi:hypothetical protein
MRTTDIISFLKEHETAYLNIQSFSKLPGIYAVFFIGKDFPLLGNAVRKHDIVYVGKTESSQEKRDAKTHFTTGKTGSSTVRKTIGALLCEREGLNPIPRNDTDFKKGRSSHFKFDDNSEVKITEWMQRNLALSFYEYPRGKAAIEALETAIIAELVPVLNISKNSKNRFKETLQQLRKNCAMMAAKESGENNVQKVQSAQKTTITTNPKTTNMPTSGKYSSLWTSYRSQIEEKLKVASDKQMIQLHADDFKKVGNRNNYSFNLEYQNGVVSNNIGGTAVARDLANVLDSSKTIMEILKEGHFKINMDKQYCLWIEKK